jgi:hypothetical protein
VLALVPSLHHFRCVPLLPSTSMMFSRLHILALCGALVVAPRAASAQITVHTTQAPFLAATLNRATDTFNDLTQAAFASPLNRAAGAYSYRSTSTSGQFFPSGSVADGWLSADAATDVVTLSNLSSTVRGVGGFFFGTDINGAFSTGVSIVVTATSGAFTATQTLTGTTLSTFLGFTSVGAFTTFTIQAVQPASGDFVWASMNDLTLGTLAPNTVVPEPSSLMLFGSALLILAVTQQRRRRTRCDSLQHSIDYDASNHL